MAVRVISWLVPGGRWTAVADGERNDHRETSRRRSLFNPIGLIVDTVVPSVADAVDVDFIDIWRIGNGRLVESWVRMDLLSLMRQVGAVPS